MTATATEPLLSIRDLYTHFELDEGVVRAVDGVSFDVPRGRTLCVVGESGCGKSITAYSVMRLIQPPGRIVAGQILLHENGHDQAIDLAALPTDGRRMRAIRGGRVAMVFQEPMSALSPVHKVGEQVAEAVRLHRGLGRRAAHAEAVEAMRRVGIPSPEQRARQYPHEMSGGLRQRAVIAMALACQPALLIADEPTTALDVTIQAQILDLLRTLQAEQSMALLLITHDLGVVAQMADEVAVMYRGRVVEHAPVEALFDAPQHPYTQALLESMPARQTDRKTELRAIRGTVPDPFAHVPGCPFHPRCPEYERGVCDVGGVPPLKAVKPDHHSACLLRQKELAP